MNYTVGANNAKAGALPAGEGPPLLVVVCEDIASPNGTITFMPASVSLDGTGMPHGI